MRLCYVLQNCEILLNGTIYFMEGKIMPDEIKKIDASQAIATVAARNKAKKDILQRSEVLSAADWAEIQEQIFMIGKPAPAFLKFRDTISAFIAANKIAAVEQVRALPERWINGGMFAEFKHIHLDGKVYLLNAKQIAALDKTLVNDFKFSLKNAGTVNF